MKDVSVLGLVLSLFEKFKSDLNEQIQPGPAGRDGIDGKDGVDGINGKDGLNGRDGIDGKDGLNGKDGVDGKDGINGIDGKDGADGKDGRDGKDGLDGIDGKNGVDGKDGRDGIDGKDGINGRDGKDGLDGIDGKDGRDGLDGKDGVDGKNGIDGLNGKDGKDGLNGRDGKDGKDGKDGVDGKDGAVPELEPYLKPHLDNLNRWRENVNKSLASIGGGGSYGILENRDVEKKPLSAIADKALLVYNINKKKFVVTDLQEIFAEFQASNEPMYSRLIDVDGDTTYIGEALPGTALSSSTWRIKRIVNDNGDTTIMWAEGSADFGFVWNDRLTYTYN